MFDEHDMQLIDDVTCVKLWRIAKNLNQPLSDTIMHKAKPDIEMRTTVVYSFKCEILLFMARQKVLEHWQDSKRSRTILINSR